MQNNSRLGGGGYNLSRQIDEVISPPRLDEELIWVDRFGTLLISKVARDCGTAYSLRLDNQIRVEVVDGKPTKIESARNVSDQTIRHFFDDQVLPRILSNAGNFVLHSAAIDVGGSAILLMGDSGRGKSTLAASFHQQGFQLLGDDAIVINRDAMIFSATPVYPSLRLLPDSLKAIFPDNAVSYRTSQYSQKRDVELAFSASLDNKAVPISAGILLSSEAGPNTALQILGKADACIELVKNSFALNPTDREAARKKLNFAGAIADTIPIYSFSYPRDFTRLCEVTAAILSVI